MQALQLLAHEASECRAPSPLFVSGSAAMLEVSIMPMGCFLGTASGARGERRDELLCVAANGG